MQLYIIEANMYALEADMWREDVDDKTMGIADDYRDDAREEKKMEHYNRMLTL